MKNTLQERLRQAMAGPPKISQAALARACKITPQSVNDWVHGQTQSIEGENLLAAARLLNVSPDWLATGKGQMHATSQPASQSVRLNPAIMSEAYRLLRTSLAMQGYVYDVAENPELLCMTYEYLSDAEEVTPSNLVDFGKRLAEARERGEKREQGGKTGRADSGGI